MLTCLACLLAIEVVEMLIQKERDPKDSVLPRLRSAGEVGVSREHNEEMRGDDDDKCHQSDGVGGDGLGGKLEQELSEGRPEVLVGDAGTGSPVLELLEVLLI